LTLKLFNSLGRKRAPFKPIRGRTARMYTCGPTVWNFAHVGNFRTFVFEDILRRYLKFKGYGVKQVMNITDVEDNIIKGMKQFGMTRGELTSKYEKAFMDDANTLSIERAEVYPRATEHLPEMVALVKKLLAKGFAYKGSDGSIYYDVSKFKGYGKLSGIKPGELKAGARVSSDHYDKQSASDFALWKAWDADDGDVFWETELGKGRPGWSVECSAMSMKYLGESFDIHTGGVDNKFPHHENEIAQSEAATGKRFVKYWLHSEHLRVEGEEMHKSLGNEVTLRALLSKGWNPLTIRYFLVSSHYRDPQNLTDTSLGQAEASRQRLQAFMERLRGASPRSPGTRSAGAAKMLRAFERAMDDDLNTPEALGVLFSFIKEVNRLIDRNAVNGKEAKSALKALLRVNSVLGVLSFGDESLAPEMLELISKREEARKAGDYAKADELRAQLLAGGIVVEDTRDGTVWKRRQGS
jgi:cysteinyl-tRNA synthetase